MKKVLSLLVVLAFGFSAMSVVVAAEPILVRSIDFIGDRAVDSATRATYELDFGKMNPTDEEVTPVVNVVRGIFRDQRMVIVAVKIFEPSGRTVRVEIDWLDSKESATREPNRIASIKLETEMGRSLQYKSQLVRDPRPIVDSAPVNNAVEKLARLHLGVSKSEDGVRIDVQTSTAGDKKLMSLVTLSGGSWDFVKSLDSK